MNHTNYGSWGFDVVPIGWELVKLEGVLFSKLYAQAVYPVSHARDDFQTLLVLLPKARNYHRLSDKRVVVNVTASGDDELQG